MKESILEYLSYAVYYISKSTFYSTIIIISLKIIVKDILIIKQFTKINKWLIVLYGIITTSVFIYFWIYSPIDNSVFKERINQDNYAYIIMLICDTLLPFFLLIKKLGENIYFIFLVTICINIGWLFELLILAMAINRDYLP
jgi:hypothetical protein